MTEPTVDDHVRNFLLLESIEQVLRFGILGEGGRFSTAREEVKKFWFPTGDARFFGKILFTPVDGINVLQESGVGDFFIPLLVGCKILLRLLGF